tara:strand:+ start:2759 stop:3424 length:666 start_codon:yes stop_codon:yes gene_type:complete
LQLNWKNIIFDFDGVLVNSNEIRVNGFSELFYGYNSEDVNELVSYVHQNGGISRYKKIRFFFEDIRNEDISNSDVNKLAEIYSKIVEEKVEKADAIPGSEFFLNKYFKTNRLAIVSGSDQKELRRVCDKRGISRYFCSILGSPVDKSDNLRELIERQRWDVSECVYIGDSINDYDAAVLNEVEFLGVRSGAFEWKTKGVPSINDLTQLEKFLCNNDFGEKK